MSDGSIPIGVRRPMRPLGIAASGLTAQRARIDAILSNIANAETTRGVDGTPYRRKSVELQEVSFQEAFEGATETGGVEGFGGVRVAGVTEDPSDFILQYDPKHPDSDEDGYVLMPNVSIEDEMVDMMTAKRHFEANASVFEAIKSMLRRAAQL